MHNTPTTDARSTPYTRQKPDRRRHFRVQMPLAGRFLLDGADHSFETINVSCGGALLHTNVMPPFDNRLVCYFDDLGRITAKVVRYEEDRVAIEFRVTDHKREKIIDRLIWLMNKKKYALEDERSAPRESVSKTALITRADGRRIQCRVVDMSLTGAAFESTGPTLPIGEVIAVGNLKGEIVRSNTDGFAIRYLIRKTGA